MVQAWESECGGVLGLTPEGGPMCFSDIGRGALCAFLTLEGGPMCFSDTRRGPSVFFWHWKGALCAILTQQKITYCGFFVASGLLDKELEKS